MRPLWVDGAPVVLVLAWSIVQVSYCADVCGTWLPLAPDSDWRNTSAPMPRLPTSASMVVCQAHCEATPGCTAVQYCSDNGLCFGANEVLAAPTALKRCRPGQALNAVNSVPCPPQHTMHSKGYPDALVCGSIIVWRSQQLRYSNALGEYVVFVEGSDGVATRTLASASVVMGCPHNTLQLLVAFGNGRSLLKRNELHNELPSLKSEFPDAIATDEFVLLQSYIAGNNVNYAANDSPDVVPMYYGFLPLIAGTKNGYITPEAVAASSRLKTPSPTTATVLNTGSAAFLVSAVANALRDGLGVSRPDAICCEGSFMYLTRATGSTIIYAGLRGSPSVYIHFNATTGKFLKGLAPDSCYRSIDKYLLNASAFYFYSNVTDNIPVVNTDTLTVHATETPTASETPSPTSTAAVTVSDDNATSFDTLSVTHTGQALATPTETQEAAEPSLPVNALPRAAEAAVSGSGTVVAVLAVASGPAAAVVANRALGILRLSQCASLRLSDSNAAPAVLEYPLQVEVGAGDGGRFGRYRGAVILNLVLVVAVCFFLGVASRFSPRAQRPLSFLAATLVYMLSQPVARAATVVVLYDETPEWGVACVAAAVVWFGVPVCMLVWAWSCRPRFEPFRDPTGVGAVMAACMPDGVWTLRGDGDDGSEGQRDAAASARYERGWGRLHMDVRRNPAYAVADLAVSFALGVVSGVFPGTAAGCRGLAVVTVALHVAYGAGYAWRAYHSVPVRRWSVHATNAAMMVMCALMLYGEATGGLTAAQATAVAACAVTAGGVAALAQVLEAAAWALGVGARVHQKRHALLGSSTSPGTSEGTESDDGSFDQPLLAADVVSVVIAEQDGGILSLEQWEDDELV
jgi:hypothetical protein